VAPNLAYAVGKNGKVIQYDGANWSTMPAPTGEELMGVWAISSSEVWVVGKKDALYLWNGVSWQDMSGAGQANVDNDQELRDAWGDANSFYALEKDGDLYRYSRTAGPWDKRTACNVAYDMDVRDVWGDGAGNVYIAGKDKGPKPDEAAVFLYNEASNSCSKVFSTTTENNLEGVYGNGATIYAVGKGGLVADTSSGAWSESKVGNADYKDVWVSSSNTAYYAGKGGNLTTCSVVSGLDHFSISPASFNPSTCLPNAVTIIAEDAADNPITSYTDTISISTSTNHGNWSVNDADNVISPNPDSNDDGAVDYSFVASDLGVIVLDLSNTHAETLTISVSGSGVSSTSGNIGFSDNVFVITEDPVQVAGRPQAMNVALWTNDGADCFIDTNYDYNPITLDAGIDRAGVLPFANEPSIGGVAIPDGSTNPITLDFSVTPGQASFNLDSTDVGQYRLILTDNSMTHGDSVIIGTGNQLTVRPFGIAVTNIIDTLGSNPNPADPNPVNANAGSPIFTTAGYDLSATLAGVLWSGADDTNNNGVLDTGFYADNTVAPSYAWDTSLAVSLDPASYSPSPGTPGSLNYGQVAAGLFAGGSALIIDLRYTEVGSFTLQSFADDFLGEPSADIVGDDIVVGRFIPADFEVGISDDGVFAEACGAFTYIGQDFGYDTAPGFTVTAKNALGDTTAQYRDAYVKLDGSSVVVVATQDDGTDGTDAVPLDVSYDPAAMTFMPQNNGIVNYTLGADTWRFGPDAPLGEFSKHANSQVAPFQADINPAITEISDGEVTRTPPSGILDFDPVGNNQRFGRLRMDNVHGSELNALLMPVFTEYWSGFSFQKNNLDTCTTLIDTDLDSGPGPLSVPTVVYAPAMAGDIVYSYPSPGAGNTGSVDTTTELDTAAHLWLRDDWDVDGEFDNDPAARATFGIFEGNPVQIFIQQVYE
jgi:MSHA biogenesis protein MshQ